MDMRLAVADVSSHLEKSGGGAGPTSPVIFPEVLSGIIEQCSGNHAC